MSITQNLLKTHNHKYSDAIFNSNQKPKNLSPLALESYMKKIASLGLYMMKGTAISSVYGDKGNPLFDYVPPSFSSDILSKNTNSISPRKRPLTTSIFPIRANI